MGEYRDVMTICKAEKPNENCIFGGAGNVIRWFGKEGKRHEETIQQTKHPP